MRIKFCKEKQREFLKEIMKRTNCPSLKELSARLQIPYSTMKNYFIEERTLSKNLFQDLCNLGKIKINSLKVEYLEENWGKIKGGKKKRKDGPAQN